MTDQQRVLGLASLPARFWVRFLRSVRTAGQVDQHRQSAWQRALVDAGNYANNAAVRYGFIAAPLGGAVAVIASVLSTGRPLWFALIMAILGGVVAWASAVGLSLAVARVRAPRKQRDEARQALVVARQELEDRENDQERRPAALLLRTELRDIQRKVANVEATVAGHTYPDGFAFPGAEWTRYGDLMAKDPALYGVLERAYSKSHRANEQINLRRSRSSGQIGKADEEDLPGVSRLAGEAIAALNSLIGDSPQDAYRGSVIAKVERSRESLHRVFDNWQALLILQSPEMLSWLSEWEPAFQDAADEIGGETITTRVKRWIESVDPDQPDANEALVDRIDAAITKTLKMLRGES